MSELTETLYDKDDGGRMRAKILRCLVSDDKGSVLTNGALDNIQKLMQSYGDQRELESTSKAAIEVARKEAEMALAVYSSVKHHILMSEKTGENIIAFIDERETLHRTRLKALTTKKERE